MADLEKILNKLKYPDNADLEELSSEELEEVEGGLNAGCPANSGCSCNLGCPPV